MEIYIDEEIDEMSVSENYDGCKESLDNFFQLGCCLLLGISMLLIVMFCIRYVFFGVVFFDLFILVEFYCFLFNYCVKIIKLFREFFGKLKSFIEFYYYCLFC